MQQDQIFSLVNVLKVVVLKDIVNVFKVEESAWMNVNALIARIVHNFHMKESQQLIRNFKEIF